MLKYKNSCIRITVLASLLIIISISCFVYYRDNLFKSLDVDLKGYEIVYGKEVKVDNLIKKNGTSFKVIQDVDTKKLGRQEVLIEVKKDNVTKVVPVTIDVMDISEPEIKLKETSVSITEGDSLNVKDYIESVVDDGENLEFKETVGENDLSYYTINTNLDTNTNGEYNVEVVAVDKANNKTVTNYTVTVNKKPEPVVVPKNTNNNTNYRVVDDAALNAAGGDIVQIAYALLGSPYASGGNSPSGFDCSGFVQYVYSRAGIHVSRSSSTQAYDGVGVSYENAMPGDILSWGHNGRVTHSAIYVGNGMMIHAANYKTGVILSNISAWENGSYDRLMYVRRIS
ncbi:MAG: C40 family peptidase [Bacilli bacterium]|nr:C40 family peptidase [Bacilli bacterium]